LAGNVHGLAQAPKGVKVNARRVSLEVRTIRVTFNAAFNQTRRLGRDERAHAVAALVQRTRLLLNDLRDRVVTDGRDGAFLDEIDRAATEVERAAQVERAA
jgi:fructose-1,6-bisphosphatase/sedoheptulose 1,7-bisphosphatase-like protein